jgi:hypothetical protein
MTELKTMNTLTVFILVNEEVFGIFIYYNNFSMAVANTCIMHVSFCE